MWSDGNTEAPFPVSLQILSLTFIKSSINLFKKFFSILYKNGIDAEILSVKLKNIKMFLILKN
jgi:hypothetical protein